MNIILAESGPRILLEKGERVRRGHLKELPSDREFKEELIGILKDQGFDIWADLLQDFTVLQENTPDTSAYTVGGRNIIVINKLGFPRKYWSPIVRHEMMHQFLDHWRRAAVAFAKHIGMDIDNAGMDVLQKLSDKIESMSYGKYGSLTNVGGDLDMSTSELQINGQYIRVHTVNGQEWHKYTDEDIELLSNCVLNGKAFKGLMINNFIGLDGRPWTDMEHATYEEILERLLTEEEEFLKTHPQNSEGPTITLHMVRGWLKDPKTFISRKTGKPVVGDSEHIYQDLDTGIYYQWDEDFEEFVELPEGGNEPGDNSVTIYIDDEDEENSQEDNPTTDPGNEQGKEKKDKPEEKPGDEPGKEKKDKPGEEPGNEPVNKPSDEPGNEPVNKPSDEPGDDKKDKQTGDTNKNTNQRDRSEDHSEQGSGDAKKADNEVIFGHYRNGKFYDDNGKEI